MSEAPRRGERILIIASASLARFVAALGIMATLRAHHADAEIVLLSSPAAAAFAGSAPYFDAVWTDDSRGSWDVARILNLRWRLRAKPFTRVYDLDGDRHSRFLFWLLYGQRGWRGRAEIAWCGSIPGTGLGHEVPARESMHLVDAWTAQLKAAGVPGVLRPDLSWVARQVKTFTLPFRMTEPFVLLALTAGPGGAWKHAGELAAALTSEGQRAVLVGDAGGQAREEISALCPSAVDLLGKSTLNE